MMFGGLALVIGAWVGMGEAASAYQQHQRDAAFNRWMVQSEAATEAKLPVLKRRFAAVPFPSDIKRASGSPTRMRGVFGAFFGPGQVTRSPSSTTAVVVDALRRAGFENVTRLARDDGWKVIGTTSVGEVWVYVHPSGQGSRISGALNPAIPHCC